MPRPIELPTLQTDRLLLRPFTLGDGARVRELAGDARVEKTTASIPHPYPEGAAETWIASHTVNWRDNGLATFALCTAADGLIGCFSVITNLQQQRGELGYWIGVPFWGRGYCTEAGRAVIPFAFAENGIGLRRVYARHFAVNPASGRVMQKLGLQYEGVQRGHDLKDGVRHDVVHYGRLHDDPA